MAHQQHNNNGGQPVKKQWANPELIFISANSVNGGVHAGVHEKLVTRSAPTTGVSGNFYVYIHPATRFLVSHPKTYYNS